VRAAKEENALVIFRHLHSGQVWRGFSPAFSRNSTFVSHRWQMYS